jgi:cytochrome c oxidase subunit II
MEKETAKIPASLLGLVGGIAIAAISLWYGQNNHLMPEHASEQAPMVEDFLT